MPIGIATLQPAHRNDAWDGTSDEYRVFIEIG